MRTHLYLKTREVSRDSHVNSSDFNNNKENTRNSSADLSQNSVGLPSE